MHLYVRSNSHFYNFMSIGRRLQKSGSRSIFLIDFAQRPPKFAHVRETIDHVAFISSAIVAISCT